MRSRFLIVAFLLVCPTVAKAAPTIESTVEGWHWKFPVPNGFCAIDPSKPADKQIWDVESRLMPPTSVMAALMFDCVSLESLRKGVRTSAKQFTYTAMKDEALTPYLRMLTRLEYIHAMVQQIPVAGTVNLAKLAAQQLKEQTGLNGNTPRFSVIDQNEYGLFAGALTNVSAPGSNESVAIATVSGGTKIGSHIFSIRLAEKYDNDKVYEQMLAEVKGATKAFLLANPY